MSEHQLNPPDELIAGCKERLIVLEDAIMRFSDYLERTGGDVPALRKAAGRYKGKLFDDPIWIGSEADPRDLTLMRLSFARLGNGYVDECYQICTALVELERISHCEPLPPGITLTDIYNKFGVDDFDEPIPLPMAEK